MSTWTVSGISAKRGSDESMAVVQPGFRSAHHPLGMLGVRRRDVRGFDGARPPQSAAAALIWNGFSLNGISQALGDMSELILRNRFGKMRDPATN